MTQNKKAQSPLVTVIMTVYNGQQYLTQALESVKGQSLQNFEMVIVDDGSDDTTPQILAEAQAKDPRIRVVTRSRIGRARALNVAWSHARGRYIANLDVDDMAEPTRLEKQVAYLRRHPEVGLLGTACTILNEVTGEKRVRRLMVKDSELRNALVRHNPFVHSSVMMPRAALEAVGGYNEAFPVSIDYELWVRLAVRFKLANMKDVLTIKRMNPDAYFQSRIPTWKKYKIRVIIRWNAWRSLARPVTELPFVVDPLSQWLYTRMGNVSRSAR